jgi:signal transduction histidine kinase
VRVLHTGKSELLTDVTPTVLQEHTHSTEHMELMLQIGVRSHMAVPLIARGRILGALNLGSTSDARRYQADDLALAEDLALRAAVAIDNARLYKEATDAVRFRDDFISMASHELRTPLTPLLLQIDTLLRRVEDIASGHTPREWIEQRLDRLAKQSRRLERLISQLLDLSRITAGRLRMDLEPVDLGAVVREAQQRLEETGELTRSGCTLTTNLADGVVGAWDRLRLEQVVENLLLNALKYGAGAPVAVSVACAGDSGVLVVQDQGIGISSADRERIFGRFERAVSSSHYGGLGVGLFIVRQVVEALQGTVVVESHLGEGAKFVVRLPTAGPCDYVSGEPSARATPRGPLSTRH